MSVLTHLVFEKIKELGADAPEFFGVDRREVEQWEAGAEVPLNAVEKVFSVEKLIASAGGKVVEAAWEGKQVAILLPFYKSTNPRTTYALMTLLDRAKMATMMQFGDAFIVHTRNHLADQWMKSEIPWAYWCDDDMIPPCGRAKWFNAVTNFDFPEEFAGVHAINRLMERGKTFIGGLYFERQKRRRPLYGGGSSEIEFAHAAPKNLVKQVPWVASGAWLMNRQVVLDIRKTFADLAPQMEGDSWHYFSNSEDALVKATAEALKVLSDSTATEQARIDEAASLLRLGRFESEKTQRLRFGEDVTFCRRASRAGHPPHVDFSVVCGHIGEHVYGPEGVRSP